MRGAALALSFLAVPVLSQEVDRSKPPQTPPLANYHLPPTIQAILPNGLLVIAVEDKRFPMVTYRLGFPAGTKYDPDEMVGLANVTGALLKEGTKARTSKQIADELASIGGSIAVETTPDSSIAGGAVLAENLSKQLELLSDVARNATFPKDEVNLRKENAKQELMAARAQAETLVEEQFLKSTFGSNPYSRMLPTEESLDRIDRDAVIAFRNAHYSPNGAVLVLVGAIPARDQLMKVVEANFGSWPKQERPEVVASKAPPAKRSVVLVDRPGSVQADMRVGQVAVNRKSPDYFPLVVGNGILGGGASSRIFMNIREKMGFAYQANSAVVGLKDSGYFNAITQVRNDVIDPALTALLKEMQSMGSSPVTSQELAGAKNYLNGSFVISLSTPTGVAMQIVNARLMGLPETYLEKYVQNVRAVAPQEIEAVSKKYIDPDDAAIVVVGDAAKIEKALEKFGTVKVEKAP